MKAFTPPITVGSKVTPSFSRASRRAAAPASASLAMRSFHSAALFGSASHAGMRYGAAIVDCSCGLTVPGTGNRAARYGARAGLVVGGVLLRFDGRKIRFERQRGSHRRDRVNCGDGGDGGGGKNHRTSQITHDLTSLDFHLLRWPRAGPNDRSSAFQENPIQRPPQATPAHRTSDITAADRAVDVRSEADFVRVTWR